MTTTTTISAAVLAQLDDLPVTELRQLLTGLGGDPKGLRKHELLSAVRTAAKRRKTAATEVSPAERAAAKNGRKAAPKPEPVEDATPAVMNGEKLTRYGKQVIGSQVHAVSFALADAWDEAATGIPADVARTVITDWMSYITTVKAG